MDTLTQSDIVNTAHNVNNINCKSVKRLMLMHQLRPIFGLVKRDFVADPLTLNGLGTKECATSGRLAPHSIFEVALPLGLVVIEEIAPFL